MYTIFVVINVGEKKKKRYSKLNALLFLLFKKTNFDL